ncbi:MAG TPA: 6-pyruvoyl-tetrahydropterin synthase-related protein [Patescibacteria group bacterium]|nr:6-pyruvoyl-tetrahydropterin synthase-related protein [Patescibacteria group bacterium]
MKKYWQYILLILLLIPSFWNLLKPGYFNMHDDLQVMRIFEMDICFADGQIPCRWAPDMGYGYGQPMFNFYSALPYYLGELIRLAFPISIIWTVKILFLISLVGGALGMYFLARELWGKWGGILAAVLYTYAPYHSLDVYVRGALAESFALMLLPFLWLAFYKLLQKGTLNKVIVTGVALGLLLMTHNVSSLIYAIPTLLWVLFWVVKDKNWAGIKNVILAGTLGIGIAAFFIVPIVFETKFVQLQWLTTDYLNYRGHFSTVYQLFISRHWGYGPSIFGPSDDLSFAVGWPHWWLAIPLAAISFFWIKNRRKIGTGILTLSMLALALFAVFLTHERSTFIWVNVPALSIVQFPWRFLGLGIFLLSLAAGALVGDKYKKEIAIGVILLAIGLNFGFFRPQHFFSQETDATKLSGESFIIQKKSAILDYLPVTAPIAPKEEAFAAPVLLSGDGEIKNYSKRSNSFFFDADIYNASEVQVPVMHFPGWVVVNGGRVIDSYPEGKYGLITFKLPPGKYIIQGRFTDTPIRFLGNSITVVSLTILLIGISLTSNKKKFLWFKN